MKTLQQIKDKYAKELGYDNWHLFLQPIVVNGFESDIDKVINDISRIVAQEALNNAAENATLEIVENNSGGKDVVGVYKQSITNSKNIPE